jgi:subtilisin family serine protease
VPINTTSWSHRKVIRYDAFADVYDHPDGDGTHVAGTLVGNALCDGCSGKLYEGNAPGANLYFVDAGYMSDEQELGADFSFIEVAENAIRLQSGIISNSWGYGPEAPGARELFDEIAYDYPEIRFFFASRNQGRSFDL